MIMSDVLIIEDDPLDRELITELLTLRGRGQVRVSQAYDLRGALELLAERTFDLVLLDTRLPDATPLYALRMIGDQAPLTPVLGWEAPHFSARVVGALLALGLLGTGAAYILYFRLIADLGASTAASVNYVVPVVAVALGVLVLGEPVTWQLVTGGALVLASMAYARRRPRLTPVRPRPTTEAAAR